MYIWIYLPIIIYHVIVGWPYTISIPCLDHGNMSRHVVDLRMNICDMFSLKPISHMPSHIICNLHIFFIYYWLRTINLRQQLDDHYDHLYWLNMITCGHILFPCLFCQILFLNVGNAHTYMFVIKYPKYHCPPLSENSRKTLGEKSQQNYIYIHVQYLRVLWKATPKEYQHAKIHVFSLGLGIHDPTSRLGMRMRWKFGWLVQGSSPSHFMILPIGSVLVW